jgi:hypothetical protein
VRWPQPLEPVDRLLGGGGDAPVGALVCFEPALPPQAACDPDTWTAVRVRFDLRWREHRGSVGDAVRALAARGAVVVDRAGVLRGPDGGAPLTRPLDAATIPQENR